MAGGWPFKFVLSFREIKESKLLILTRHSDEHQKYKQQLWHRPVLYIQRYVSSCDNRSNYFDNEYIFCTWQTRAVA